MTDIPAENVAYFTADKWGGYWQTVRDGRPYNFRLDLSHRKYVESLEERMARLEEALREAEYNVKSRLRTAFRKALAELPEIAPAEIRSVLSSVHMQDGFMVEGKRLQRVHGLDAVAPRVEQECGAGAWSFMRQGVARALSQEGSDA